MGNPTAAFRNLQAVEDWYKGFNKTGYTLYAGTQKKASDVIVKHRDLPSTDDAWESLEKNLRDASEDGGTFTVFVPTIADNMGATVTVILPRTSGGNGGGVAGIGAIGNIDKYVAEKVDTHIKIYEMQREIDDLRASQDQTVGFIGAIEKHLGQETTSALIQSLVGAAIGFLTQSKAPQNVINGTQYMPDNEYRNVGANHHPESEQPDPVNEALDEFEALGFDLETDLPALVKLAKQNPAMVKNLLGKPSVNV